MRGHAKCSVAAFYAVNAWCYLMSNRNQPSNRDPQSKQPDQPAGSDEGKDREAINAANKDRKLPHEHDQGLGEVGARNTPPKNRELIEKGRRDVEQGREDTNCLGEQDDDSACPPRPDVAKSKP